MSLFASPMSSAPPSRPLARIRPHLGWWATITLCLVAGTVVYSDFSRLENPDGEKHVPLFPPGQNDFSYSYLGARALLNGVNPYHNDKPEFTHPIWPPEDTGGFKQIYPPGNLLAHVPFVLWKGTDWMAAARIWFRLTLVELLLLSAVAWILCRRILVLSLTPLWIPFFFICLAFNTGVELALERGQSDIAAALLVWAAIVFFVRGQYGLSTFLCVASTSIKGYAVLLAIGIVALAFDRGRWKTPLLAAGIAIALVVVPAGHLLGESARAIAFRKDMFWAVWYNHSFSNAAYTLAPSAKERGRHIITLFALAVTVAAWVQARRTQSRGRPEAAALWLVAFGVASLGTMIGYSALSVSYNLIMVLPGVVVLVVCQRRLDTATRPAPWFAHPLGAGLLASTFMLFSYRLGGSGPPLNGTGLASSAFGLILILVILAVVLARAAILRDFSQETSKALLEGAAAAGHPTLAPSITPSAGSEER